MALVKHACGACGTEVSVGDERCPRCAQTLEWAGPGVGEGTKCGVCGFQNPPGVAICGSCGARLRSGTAKTAAREAPVDRSTKKRPAGRPSSTPAPPRRFEAWQIISGIAVVGLLVFLLYLELSRQQDPSRPVTALSTAPVTQQAPAFQDITPFERAVAANPKDPAALLALANAMHDIGMFPRAIDTYKQYLAIRPNDPDARVDMAVCYYGLGVQDTVNPAALFSTALREMQTALKGTPTHQPAAFNIGIVNLHMGNLEEARTWFRKTVELNKSSELGLKAQKMLEQHAFTP